MSTFSANVVNHPLSRMRHGLEGPFSYAPPGGLIRRLFADDQEDHDCWVQFIVWPAPDIPFCSQQSLRELIVATTDRPSFIGTDSFAGR